MQVHSVKEQIDVDEIASFEKDSALRGFRHPHLIDWQRHTESGRLFGYLGSVHRLRLRLPAGIKGNLLEKPLQSPVLQVRRNQQGTETCQR